MKTRTIIDKIVLFEKCLDEYDDRLEKLSYSNYLDKIDINSNKNCLTWLDSIYNDLKSSHKRAGEKLLTKQDIPSILPSSLFNQICLLDLLQPKSLPEFPDPPISLKIENIPPGFVRHVKSLILKEKALQVKSINLKKDFQQKLNDDILKFKLLKNSCSNTDPSKVISILLKIANFFYPLPTSLNMDFDINYDPDIRIVIGTINLPDLSTLEIKKGDGLPSVSKIENRRLIDTIFYSLILRTAYQISQADVGDWFDLIAINVIQKWRDPATGNPLEGITASMQVVKKEILNLQLHHVDPKSCFRHLKGISTPSLERISPIRPIFVMNKNDRRIIENRDVAEGLETEANLALMPWDDFEHLVRQLFEWEFSNKGIEVKVTRASRDKGVDAIMFDPDPLRGGKYILQAKRYTRPVDVAAVRDLYGTVVNEGANRGILVTTSSYGPDAYEFAKNKPISLVDGPNLISLLQSHGRKFRIDLEEARNMRMMD